MKLVIDFIFRPKTSYPDSWKPAFVAMQLGFLAGALGLLLRDLFIIYTIENNHKFKRYYEELRIRQEQEKKLRRRREVIQLEDKRVAKDWLSFLHRQSQGKF